MEVCLRPLCERCANFEKPCAGVNEECADVDNSKTCLCKKSFIRDGSGNCTKCDSLRPWPCQARKFKYEVLDESFFSVKKIPAFGH